MLCTGHQLLNIFMSELLLRDQSRQKMGGGWVFAGQVLCAWANRKQDT